MTATGFNLGLYEKAVPAVLSWEEKLKSCRNAGFDYMEISIDETDDRLSRLDWPRRERSDLLRLSEDLDVPIKTMCLSAHRKFPLGSHDRNLTDASIEIMRKAAGFACDLGIRIIQLAGYDVYYETSDEYTRETFLENLYKCVDIAAANGVLLGFETMELPFMNSVSKAMKYVSLVDSPYLNVYPDIGNISNGVDDVTADLLTGKGRIIAAHLKETIPGVYRDMRFGEGAVDFVNALKTLIGLGVNLYVAEFWYQAGSGTNFREELKSARQYIANAYDKAKL